MGAEEGKKQINKTLMVPLSLTAGIIGLVSIHYQKHLLQFCLIFFRYKASFGLFFQFLHFAAILIL